MSTKKVIKKFDKVLREFARRSMGDDNNLWTTTQRKDERSVLSSLYFIFFLFLLLFFFFFLFIFHSLSLSLFTFFKGNVFQNSSFEITRTFSLPIVDTPISKEVFLINGCVGRVRTFIVSHFYSLVFIFLSFPSWKKSFLPRLPSSSNIFRIDRTNARLLPLFFARVLEKIVPIDIVVLFISYYFFFPSRLFILLLIYSFVFHRLFLFLALRYFFFLFVSTYVCMSVYIPSGCTMIILILLKKRRRAYFNSFFLSFIIPFFFFILHPNR